MYSWNARRATIRTRSTNSADVPLAWRETGMPTKWWMPQISRSNTVRFTYWALGKAEQVQQNAGELMKSFPPKARSIQLQLLAFPDRFSHWIQPLQNQHACQCDLLFDYEYEFRKAGTACPKPDQECVVSPPISSACSLAIRDIE